VLPSYRSPLAVILPSNCRLYTDAKPSSAGGNEAPSERVAITQMHTADSPAKRIKNAELLWTTGSEAFIIRSPVWYTDAAAHSSRSSIIAPEAMKAIRAIVPGAVGMLLSMWAAAQGPIASDQPASVSIPSIGAAMMRVVPYPDEIYSFPGTAPASCYRVGRCSAYDLYRFRDRPNRLTRLAPEAPMERVAPPSIHYLWFLVPVTPEENILPKYRTASQIRDEYRAVGRPIDSPH
jgi:hypothetical protein